MPRKRKRSPAQRHADKAAELLTEAGFDASVKGPPTGPRLVVRAVTHLGVSSTGQIYSVGEHESVPVRATCENIVDVVKAVKELRDIVAGHHCHCHEEH